MAAVTSSDGQVETLGVDVRHIAMTYTIRRDGLEENMSVLTDVNMSISEGEFCCVIGPSGCGKSTLLRVIGGLLTPTEGQIVIAGQVSAAPRQDVGIVFQSFNLFPWRTVLKNIEFGLENRGEASERRREIARYWIGRMGLEGFELFYPGQLSGGMQQRVGLARALAIEPSILLMDEPFGSLDAQTRLLMQGELMDLWSTERKTVVFVTHDVEEALFLADRVFVLSPRPGSLIDTVKVPFPRPRLDALRGDPEFAALKERLWERLKVITVQGQIGGRGDKGVRHDPKYPGRH